MCGIVMLRKEERRERVMESGDILDTIMNHVLDDHSGESPKFVRDCEKKIAAEVHKYTDRIRMTDAGEPSGGEEAETFAEKNADGLLDSICDSNRIYMKTGLKLGANLVFQLLGL